MPDAVFGLHQHLPWHGGSRQWRQRRQHRIDGSEGGALPPGCDEKAEPKDSPACLANDFAMFVGSVKGSDTNAGTREAPVKSISGALGKLEGRARVYVCAGTYREAVKLTSSVNIYGGFACGSWAYDGSKPVVQAPAGTDYALDVSASNLTVSDLELHGPDVGAPNSIAVRAVDALGLVFVRAKAVAKQGAKGADGTLVPFVFPKKADLDGKNGAGISGGEARVVTCEGGEVTTGGKGGNIGADGLAGMPDRGGGAAGSFGACQTNQTGGGTGGAGLSPAAASGANTPGALVANAWAPSGGTSGSKGGPGQGGGGGAGVNNGANVGAGGGGGAGGCGGAGGPGGGGGGASIALLSIGSSVTLKGSELIAGTAGDGGKGAAGQPGQTEFGSGGVQVPDGCAGGRGGTGGNGAAGGGGAAGMSAGVLYKGAKPTFEPETITKGTAGKKGVGGVPGANDGIQTEPQATLPIE